MLEEGRRLAFIGGEIAVFLCGGFPDGVGRRLAQMTPSCIPTVLMARHIEATPAFQRIARLGVAGQVRRQEEMLRFLRPEVLPRTYNLQAASVAA